MTQSQIDSAPKWAVRMLERVGTQIVVYVNTERVCAKELVLFPWQICPEHIHPQLGDYPGKEETFRCRWGEVYLYLPGQPAKKPMAKVPEPHRKHLRVRNEIVLKPGEQYALKERTLHWFQAGEGGRRNRPGRSPQPAGTIHCARPSGCGRWR